MKSFNKLIAFFLATVTLLSAAVACNGDTSADTTGSAVIDTTTPDTTTPTDTTSLSVGDTTAPESDETTGDQLKPEELFDTPETITIEKDGSSLNYEITRSMLAGSTSIEMTATQQLSAYFKERIGVTPKLSTDRAKEEDSEKLEIIIGSTDHPEAQALLNDVPSYGDYAVRAVGNKLIVIAFEELGYNMAMNHLKSVLSKGYDRKTKTITVNTERLNNIGTVNKQLSSLPVYEGGQFYASYDAGRVTASTNCSEIILMSATAEEHHTYLEKLKTEGYTQYTENTIGKNYFATYTNSKYTINVGFYASDRSARLLIEPKGSLPARAEDNKYDPKKDKLTTAQITMIAVGKGSDNVGLSMLIRLEDGRFIVIDGAYSSRYSHLISTIKSQASEYTDKPVIAAWIITHGHHDHAAVLAGKYSNIKNAGITVESILLNEVSTSDPTSGEGYKYTKKIIEEAAPALGADLYKPHVGQVFNYPNCRIDILYTQESNAPEACNAYNATSPIMKLTFTDTGTGKQTTLLSTADATGLAMGITKNTFGDYIKCDIITVNHHGLSTKGADTEMAETFKTVAPKLVLWPIGNKDTGLTDVFYNKVLIDVNQNPEFKEVYFAGDEGSRGDIVVPLPYVPGNVQRVK